MRRRPLGLIASVLLVAGCATAATKPPSVDVTGRWVGTWMGHGVQAIPRDQDVTLDLAQSGGVGEGRLVMDGTLAAESVPDTIRNAAMVGVRVVFDVSGNHVRLTHELGPSVFEAQMVVSGDRMLGRLLGAWPYVYLDLTRGKPRAGLTPVASAPRPPPPPPPPVQAEPPPVAEPPRVVAAPALPPAPPAPAPAPAIPPPAEVPVRAAARPFEFRAMPELRPIHFDFDSSEIRPADTAILDANAEWLRGHPEHLVLIEGHCDERGTPEYNLVLGERRARSTMAYLIGRGVAQTRMTVTSYGLERPACAEHTEACWAASRRAVMLVKPR